MKTLRVLILLLPFVVFGQNNPDCDHLKVEDIYMDGVTPNLMKVKLSNSCTDCNSGIEGCVYLELKVIKRTGDEDTIAASNCMCLISPNNNGEKTYSINSEVTSLPAMNDLRITLSAGICGCDDVPLNLTTSMNKASAADSIGIFPNPTTDFITVNSKKGNHNVRIIDSKGIVKISQKLQSENEKVNTSTLSKGIYIVEIIDQNSRKTLKSVKIIKE